MPTILHQLEILRDARLLDRDTDVARIVDEIGIDAQWVRRSFALKAGKPWFWSDDIVAMGYARRSMLLQIQAMEVADWADREACEAFEHFTGVPFFDTFTNSSSGVPSVGTDLTIASLLEAQHRIAASVGMSSDRFGDLAGRFMGIKINGVAFDWCSSDEPTE